MKSLKKLTIPHFNDLHGNSSAMRAEKSSGRVSKVRSKGKKLAVCLLFAALTLSLVACGADKLSGDEAWSALEKANTLYLTGDLDDVNTFSDITANDQVVGKVQEKGLINNSMVVIVDGKEQFCYKYVTSGAIMDGNVGTTYGCFDMDGNCLGYMQLQFGNGTSRYAFLTADGGDKGYYLDENLTTFTNAGGEPIGSVEAVLDSLASHAFHVTIKTYATPEKIDYKDKLAVYWSAVSLLNTEYSYLT